MIIEIKDNMLIKLNKAVNNNKQQYDKEPVET